jgi:hypothetical protein
MCLHKKHKQENLKGGVISYLAINHGFINSIEILEEKVEELFFNNLRVKNAIIHAYESMSYRMTKVIQKKRGVSRY